MPGEQGGAAGLGQRFGGSQGRGCGGMVARKDPLAHAAGTDLPQQKFHRHPMKPGAGPLSLASSDDFRSFQSIGFTLHG